MNEELIVELTGGNGSLWQEAGTFKVVIRENWGFTLPTAWVAQSSDTRTKECSQVTTIPNENTGGIVLKFPLHINTIQDRKAKEIVHYAYLSATEETKEPVSSIDLKLSYDIDPDLRGEYFDCKSPKQWVRSMISVDWKIESSKKEGASLRQEVWSPDISALLIKMIEQVQTEEYEVDA